MDRLTADSRRVTADGGQRTPARFRGFGEKGRRVGAVKSVVDLGWVEDLISKTRLLSRLELPDLGVVETAERAGEAVTVGESASTS